MATLRERLAASDTDAALRLVAEARPRLFSKVAELRTCHLKNASELSDLTRDSYSADARRVASAGGDPRSIAGTYASFRKLRAACLWKAREDLRECLLNADRKRKKGGASELDALCQYDEQLPEIERRLLFLESLKFNSELAVHRERTHKQRHKLGRLPTDWLARIHQKSMAGMYGDAVALSILIPVRPAEIAQRVQVRLNSNGSLDFEIRGSKIRRRGTGVAADICDIGQPVRWLTLSAVDTTRGEIFEWLCARVGQNGGTLSIGGGLSARGISSAFRAMSRSLFKGMKAPPSIYALRHAACAELKATGLSAESVAMGMGHTSVRSQKAYGTRAQGRGGYVISTSAAKPVRVQEAPVHPADRHTPRRAHRMR